MNTSTQTLTPRTSLRTLVRHAEASHAKSSAWNWSDDLSHLPEARRMAWRRVISSICTAEGIEETMMRPLQAGMTHDADATEYLAAHARDEERHHVLLKRYLKNTFGYRKKARTLSDAVFYDTVFPRVAALFSRRPAIGVALIHCYEKFSLSFYADVRAKAQADGAQNLLTLFRAIERDELRHLAGCVALLKRMTAERPLTVVDRVILAAVLRLVQLDVNMGPWAIHNRELKACIDELGIDTTKLAKAAAAAVKETHALAC